MYVCMSRTGQSPGALRAQHTCLYIASPPERLRGCYKHEGERAKKERPCCPVPVACQGKTSLACICTRKQTGYMSTVDMTTSRSGLTMKHMVCVCVFDRSNFNIR